MSHFAVLVFFLMVFNPLWSERLAVLSASRKLAVMQRLSWAELSFPRWQGVLAITIISIVVGLDPAMTQASPSGVALPRFMAIGLGIALVWPMFLATVGMLRWWAKRGGRWNGHGSLFNLLAAVWLVPDVLGAGLIALGVPLAYTVPIWLYSIWVGGKALSGAVPGASLSYCIGGILLSLIPATLVATGVTVLLSTAFLGQPDIASLPGG